MKNFLKNIWAWFLVLLPFILLALFVGIVAYQDGREQAIRHEIELSDPAYYLYESDDLGSDAYLYDAEW